VRLHLVLADPLVAASLQRGLEPFGYSVSVCADLAQTLLKATSDPPDILLLQIPDDPGLLVQYVGAGNQLAEMQGRHIPVIFLASDARFELKLAAASAGGDLFFALPVDETLLTHGAKVALAVRLFDQEIVGLEGAAKIAGISQSEMIDHLGALRIPVLRFGPGELDAEIANAMRLADRG
jgi:CheY-like chemotaxis protein